LTGPAASYGPEDIAPVVRPLYDVLAAHLARAGAPVTGPAVAYYEDTPGDGVLVHAGLTVGAPPADRYDFAVVDLPPVEHAAALVHLGPMDEVLPAYEALARCVDANGWVVNGSTRELYLAASPDCTAEVTVLQQPVVKG
jgi:effector-binding domain-containing protein